MTNYIQILLLGALLSGCASSKPRIVRMSDVPGTFVPSSEIESVRTYENIKSYPMGRYIDPSNPRIMHEGHPIYRVESTAKWNLHPNRPVALPTGPALGVADSAQKEELARDELYLELNRQKQTSARILDGSQTISTQLQQLGKQLQTTQVISEEVVRLRAEVDMTQRRIEAFEEELRKKQDVSHPQ